VQLLKNKNKMLITVFQILYYLVFFMMFLMSIFIVFHVVSYSSTASSKFMTLAIFVPVAGVLLATNFFLFSRLPLETIFAGLLP
jgi:hypothetical protein